MSILELHLWIKRGWIKDKLYLCRWDLAGATKNGGNTIIEPVTAKSFRHVDLISIFFFSKGDWM